MLTVGEVAGRSGFAASALRYYERAGLIEAERTPGGQRRYPRSRELLARLPSSRTPNRRDWTRISRLWRDRLDAEIDALVALRNGLDSCIGCGCLSLQRCRLSNPKDVAAPGGPGAVYLPKRLREPLPDDRG